MEINNVMDGYNITESQVELIAMLLIFKNGSTTNLDIKKMFRSSGFNVTQKLISDMMTSLEEKHFFVSSVKTNHRIYVIPYDRMNTLFLTKSNGTGQPAGCSHSIPASNTYSAINNQLKPNTTAPNTNTVNTTQPTQPNTYKSTSIIADTTKIYDGCWLVSSKYANGVYIHSTLTRSQARTKFAKEFGIHYNDVRCKKVKIK